MDKKETKKPKNLRKTSKVKTGSKTVGKSMEKDLARAMKEIKEPLKELRGLWKDLKEGIGI